MTADTNQNETNGQLAELSHLREAIEFALDQFTQIEEGCPSRLSDAIRYSVLASGKRLRPILALLACQAVGGDWKSALPAACAIEFIHVYSLIHDDLPAMDNDNLRRGKPTCHVKFDEATAILAGDSLQMLAFEVLTRELPETVALNCCKTLAKAAGRSHLVGGQADDLAAEGRFGPIGGSGTQPLDFLKKIHRRKTGALIEASLQMGGIVGGASTQHLESLSQYGSAIGLAFQIVDDCLDVESTTEELGKTIGKDSEQGKLTYPGLMGLAESRQLADHLISDACKTAAVFNERGKALVELAKFVVERRK